MCLQEGSAALLGSSPPCHGSGRSLVRVLTEFTVRPQSDGLRSPMGKPQCVGQYSIAEDCPHGYPPPLGNASWALNVF